MQTILTDASFWSQALMVEGEPTEIVIRTVTGLVVACVLAMLTAMVYRATHRGLQYSRSFVFTLVMLACVGALVMMVIGDSLARAFGVFGALSLVRFRTAVKDPKDMAFVFLALAIGMAAGTGHNVMAAIGTLVICAIVSVMSWMQFGGRTRADMLVRVVYDQTATAAVDEIFKAEVKRLTLLTMQGFDGDAAVEVTYLARLQAGPEQLVSRLQGTSGVREAHVSTAHEDIEIG